MTFLYGTTSHNIILCAMAKFSLLSTNAWNSRYTLSTNATSSGSLNAPPPNSLRPSKPADMLSRLFSTGYGTMPLMLASGLSANRSAKMARASSSGPLWKSWVRMTGAFCGGGLLKATRRAWLPSFVAWNLFMKATIWGSAVGGKTRGPAKTGFGCGCPWKVNLVTTPKFWPAPRIAQNRSALCVWEAVTASPEARTISTETRLSMVSPCLPLR